jgi:hypothetical protein
MSSEMKTLEVLFHAQLMRMCQIMTFGKLSNDVDTTETGSMCVVAGRVAISYVCPASL